jgi:signal transduction histidine kinase
MESLGNQADNASLRRQQSILARFGELALRSQDLDEILTEACRLVGEALGTDLAKVVELQPDGRSLLVRAGVGWKPNVVGVATITAADNTSEAIALKTGKPMISRDISLETRFIYPSFLVDNGVRAVVNVLVLGGSDRPPFGILQVDSREPRQFNDDDTAFLQGYANLIAAAVYRLRIAEELRGKEAQLRQSQKLEAIGRLAAGVAHDFNNILQSVCGGLELVLEDVQPGTLTHEVARLALTSAGRGASITQHLLSYARKQALQPKQLNVGLFLAEMLQSDPGLPCIRVDPGQLQTALLNLSINAAHAMPQGGTLTLEGRTCAEADEKCVIIAITDNGIGMDQATLAQAAEPFFTTKGVAGSGLGLSMVQGFAEQSGGAMRIESSTGKGTRVELQLPAVDPVDGDPVEQRTAPMRLQGSGRVLLVDDAADVLLITAAFLRRVGFTVAKAENGPKALSLLASEGFDVLLTDYAMVELNGVALIQQARKTRPGLPAVIITGYAEVSDSLPGGVAVLGKPFSRQSLVDALTDAIGKGPNH